MNPNRLRQTSLLLSPQDQCSQIPGYRPKQIEKAFIALQVLWSRWLAEQNMDEVQIKLRRTMLRQRQELKRHSFDLITQLAVKIFIVLSKYLVGESLAVSAALLFRLHMLEKRLCWNVRDIIGGLDLEQGVVPVDEGRDSVVAGQEVEEKLSFEEGVDLLDGGFCVWVHYNLIMKWITLKSKNLPIIALEIDRAIEVFTAITEKAESSRSNEDMEELQILKKDFEKRISQLDVYYKQHYLDENISIFHMLRMKMQRTVFISNRRIAALTTMSKKESMFSLDEPLFKEGSIKMLDQPLFSYYQSSLKNQNSELKKRLSIKKQQKTAEETSPKNLKKDRNGSNFFKNQKNVNQKPARREKQTKHPATKLTTKQFIAKDSIKLKTLQKERESQFNTANFGQKTKNNGSFTPSFKSEYINPSLLLQQMKKSSELTFTIKMTKQEYKSLLSIKSQLKQTAK